MSDYSEVTYWLTLITQSGLKLSLIKPIIQRWCISDDRQLADVFDLSPLELSTTFGLTDDQAEQIKRTAAKLDLQARELELWKTQGFEPIIRTDPRYPKRLIYVMAPAKQPLILWSQGNVELLDRPGVTILGTDDLDDSTARFIEELISTLSSEKVGLVSGYGRGLDRVTFEAMLGRQHGYTITMLPLGLDAFAKTTTALHQFVEDGRTVLVSPFSPNTPYQENLAEARNLLIDHLTLALLIPESDQVSTGRAEAALERGLPVFVKANTAGNRALLDQGALLLTDPGEVIDWVQQAMVDAAMFESQTESPPEALAAAPLANTAPADPPESDEDFALRYEDAPPLDREEAMEVLSLGGEIPEVLRRRLEENQDEE